MCKVRNFECIKREKVQNVNSKKGDINSFSNGFVRKKY